VQNPNEIVLDACVSAACLELFQDYALPLKRVMQGELLDVELLFCGVVGFTGEQLRGTLLLATSREPLGRTTPAVESSLREWIAELANQLIGRIKNKLLNHNVNLLLSTPVVLRGVQIAPVSRAELVPYAFACDGGNVCVWFDAEILNGVDLTQTVAAEGVVAEGSTTFFF
jgi:hypothetical protein